MKNWKTNAIGLLLALLGVIRASKAPSILAAVRDGQVQMELVGAAVAVLAKDYDK